MTLYDKARQFAARYQVPTTGERSWDQMCGSLMFRFSQYVGWNRAPFKNISPAWGAGKSSGPLNTDPSKAPIGAYHFWQGTDGHTGIDLTGGGQDVFMATFALKSSWGKAIGINSIAAYSSAKRGIVTHPR